MMDNSILTNSCCEYEVEDWEVILDKKGKTIGQKKIGIHQEIGVFIQLTVEGCGEEFYTRAIVLNKNGKLITIDFDKIKFDMQSIKETLKNKLEQENEGEYEKFSRENNIGWRF